MAVSIVERDDLILSLMEGVNEPRPLATFLQRLVTRTQARHGILLLSPAGEPVRKDAEVLHFAAPRARHDPDIVITDLMKLDLHPLGSLRPDRIYAIEEMVDYDDPAALARQREGLAAMGIRFGRWLRVTAGGGIEGWILLTRETEDFSSAAVATLASVVPYLKAALRLIAATTEERLMRMTAQGALARLGVGQVALDENASVLTADPTAGSVLGFVSGPGGTRIQMPPAAQDTLLHLCRQYASQPGADRQPTCIPLTDDMALLVRAAPDASSFATRRPAAIATIRISAREDEGRGALVLRTLHDLSNSEAALAEKLSRGLTIAEAGRALQLTEETARNYSKRIYARTGSRGHADLVRTVLTGLAPLA